MSYQASWTPQEDELLLRLVEAQGAHKWTELAQHFGRTGKSCRLRWYNHLSPEVKHTPFTKWEDAVVIQAHHEQGNKWSAIAKMVPGRTDNSVKNRWNSTLRRKAQAGTLNNRYIDQGLGLDALLGLPDDAQQEGANSDSETDAPKVADRKQPKAKAAKRASGSAATTSDAPPTVPRNIVKLQPMAAAGQEAGEEEEDTNDDGSLVERVGSSEGGAREEAEVHVKVELLDPPDTASDTPRLPALSQPPKVRATQELDLSQAHQPCSTSAVDGSDLAHQHGSSAEGRRITMPDDGHDWQQQQQQQVHPQIQHHHAPSGTQDQQPQHDPRSQQQQQQQSRPPGARASPQAALGGPTPPQPQQHLVRQQPPRAHPSTAAGRLRASNLSSSAASGQPSPVPPSPHQQQQQQQQGLHPPTTQRRQQQQPQQQHLDRSSSHTASADQLSKAPWQWQAPLGQQQQPQQQSGWAFAPAPSCDQPASSGWTQQHHKPSLQQQQQQQQHAALLRQLPASSPHQLPPEAPFSAGPSAAPSWAWQEPVGGFSPSFPSSQPQQQPPQQHPHAGPRPTPSRHSVVSGLHAAPLFGGGRMPGSNMPGGEFHAQGPPGVREAVSHGRQQQQQWQAQPQSPPAAPHHHWPAQPHSLQPHSSQTHTSQPYFSQPQPSEPHPFQHLSQPHAQPRSQHQPPPHQQLASQPPSQQYYQSLQQHQQQLFGHAPVPGYQQTYDGMQDGGFGAPQLHGRQQSQQQPQQQRQLQRLQQSQPQQQQVFRFPLPTLAAGQQVLTDVRQPLLSHHSAQQQQHARPSQPQGGSHNQPAGYLQGGVGSSHASPPDEYHSYSHMATPHPGGSWPRPTGSQQYDASMPSHHQQPQHQQQRQQQQHRLQRPNAPDSQHDSQHHPQQRHYEPQPFFGAEHQDGGHDHHQPSHPAYGQQQQHQQFQASQGQQGSHDSGLQQQVGSAAGGTSRQQNPAGPLMTQQANSLQQQQQLQQRQRQLSQPASFAGPTFELAAQQPQVPASRQPPHPAFPGALGVPPTGRGGPTSASRHAVPGLPVASVAVAQSADRQSLQPPPASSSAIEAVPDDDVDDRPADETPSAFLMSVPPTDLAEAFDNLMDEGSDDIDWGQVLDTLDLEEGDGFHEMAAAAAAAATSPPGSAPAPRASSGLGMPSGLTRLTSSPAVMQGPSNMGGHARLAHDATPNQPFGVSTAAAAAAPHATMEGRPSSDPQTAATGGAVPSLGGGVKRSRTGSPGLAALRGLDRRASMPNVMQDLSGPSTRDSTGGGQAVPPGPPFLTHEHSGGAGPSSAALSAPRPYFGSGHRFPATSAMPADMRDCMMKAAWLYVRHTKSDAGDPLLTMFRKR